MWFAFRIVFAAIALSLVSCEPSSEDAGDPSPIVTAKVDVYAVGWNSDVNGNRTIMLWKNRAGQIIEDGTRKIEVGNIFVSGEDVYVVGSERKGKYQEILVLWKNGVWHKITDGARVARANSIFVSGSDVYLAGYEWDYNIQHVPKLWKNGIAQNLPVAEDKQGKANSVYVFGNDVYVAGYENKKDYRPPKGAVYWGWSPGPDLAYELLGSYRAMLWKNGTAQSLFCDKGGQAKSVFVSHSDVYVAGVSNSLQTGDTPIATLWKNDLPTCLTTKAEYVRIEAEYRRNPYIHIEEINYNKLTDRVRKSGFAKNPDFYESWNKKTNKFYASEEQFRAWNSPVGSSAYDAYSVFVSGMDVYVTGRKFEDVMWVRKEDGKYVRIEKIERSSRIVLWKNDIEQYLEDVDELGNEESFVFVSGKDVYVCSHQHPDRSNKEKALLLKNGKAVTLTDDKNSFPLAVFVSM